MLVLVTLMIASLGSLMIGSATSSIETSRNPCQVTAFIVVSCLTPSAVALLDHVLGRLAHAREGAVQVGGDDLAPRAPSFPCRHCSQRQTLSQSHIEGQKSCS